MTTELLFPTPDPMRESPRRDFAPFLPQSHADWLARTLDQLTVRGVTAVWYRCRPTWTLDARRIQDDMFLYVIKGQLDINVEGRSASVTRGASAHFRRSAPHRAAANPRLPTEIISFHYTATAFESLTLPALLDFPDVFHLAGDRVIETILTESCRAYFRRPAGYRRDLEALALRLLFRVIHTHGAWLRPLAPAAKLGDLRRLLPALESLRHDLAEPLAIDALARRCGFSESQFRRVFQRAMGVLPVRYQRQIRLERACQLLRQTGLTVEAVAAAVGYAETAYFAHSFKRLIGVSPGRYRAVSEM